MTAPPAGPDRSKGGRSLELEASEGTSLVPKSSVRPRPEPSGRHFTRGLSAIPAITSFGRYQILGRIALGGMAEIFLAREQGEAGTSRSLVIKRVLSHVADDERFQKMFLDEARLAMKLSHPGICHMYEFGQLEGSYFIAMEWVNGVPLGKLIKRAKRHTGGVPPFIAARIIAQTAEALEYAHTAVDDDGTPLGIVHRDVSPQNIMVSFNGSVKLLDFGIAKADSHDTKTSAGQVKGKFAYMSPQQCVGDPIDGRADVFALGVCLYEALTAKNLYRRKTEYETMRAIIEGPVPSPRSVHAHVPAELDGICQRALAKDPADRFQTAGEMQQALEEWLAQRQQVVNAAALAEYTGTLFREERERGPLVDSVPFGTSVGPPPQDPEKKPKKRGALFVLLGFLFVGVMLLSGAAVGYVAWAHPETASEWMGQLTEQEPEPPAPEPIAPENPVVEAPDPPPEPPPADVPDWETGSVEETPRVIAGTIAANSTPPGAQLRVEGQEDIRERTPTRFELPPGTYVVTLRLTDHRPHRQEIEVVSGETVRVNARLRAEEPAEAPAGGRLSINTRPWSKVYVGSRQLGTTPIGRVALPAGPVRLRLVDRDGNTHQRTVQVVPNDETRVFFDLSGQ
ncbi:MAG: serine/threonine-protein kinase [Myxococcota bacterium]